MHYIRFLSPPKVAEGPRSGLTISAVVAVTTDLGDSFYPGDLTLRVDIVDALPSPKILQSQEYACPGYSRAVKIALVVSGKAISREVCVHVATTPTTTTPASGVDHVLDVWSTPFRLANKQRAEPLVERRLSLSNSSLPLRVLEETGDSIARHIWDASLGFLQFFDQVLLSSFPSPATRSGQISSDLHQLILCKQSQHKALRVIELGAGCGIVGIAFAQLVKSDVLLTDLDDALDILNSNIGLAAPVAGSRLEASVLDWSSDSLPSSSFATHYDLVLVSDCIYNPDSSVHLVETLKGLSSQSQSQGLPPPHILVGYKNRHSADQIFFDRMKEARFRIVGSGSIQLSPCANNADPDDNPDEARPVIEFFEYRLQS